MKISSILKKEYYGQTFFFDMVDIGFIIYDQENRELRISFKHTGGNPLVIKRHANDAKDDLKRISLDIYSSWNTYIENMTIITTMSGQEE